MPGSLRLKYAFKTALGAVIAVGLAMWFRWDRPYWSGISVLVVMLPYVGASIEKSLRRLGGTWAGALAGVLMTAAFAQEPGLFTVALALAVILFVYLGGSNYGVIMGVGTMAMIAFAGLQDPHLVWHFACYRAAEVSLGVTVALFMQISLWPRKAGDDLRELFREMLRDLQAYLGAVVARFTTGEAGEGDLDLRQTGMLGRFLRMEELLSLAVRESDEIRRRQELYRSLIFQLKEIFISLSSLRQCLEGEVATEYRVEFSRELKEFATSARGEIESFEGALGGGGMGEAAEYREKFLAINDRLDALRRRRVPHGYSEETSLRVLAFVKSLSDLTDSITSTRGALSDLLAGERARPRRALPGLSRSRFDPDRRRLRRAVRIAAGILFAFYGWWYLRWPSGMQVIISFLVVTAQPHIAGTNVKIVTRLAGALIGCALAIFSCVYILPHLESLWGLAPLLFCVLFATSFVNAGPPRYSYTGFQAGLCYLLTVAQGFHKDVTFMPALNRATGIMLGALLGAAAVRLVFPPAPRREFCRDMETLFGLFRDSLEKMRDGSLAPAIGRALSDRSPVLLNLCREWLRQMHFFRPEEREKVSCVLPATQVLSYGIIALCRARAALGGRALVGRLETALCGLQRGIEETFERCREVFRAEDNREPIPSLEGVRREVDEEIRRIRREGAAREVPTEEIYLTGAVVVAYTNLAGDVESCAEIVSGFDFVEWDPEVPV